MAGVHRSIDALLDYSNQCRMELLSERAKSETLRDALSECLAELPDSPNWRSYQELYVLTDPVFAMSEE